MNFSINGIANGTANFIWAVLGGFILAIWYWAMAITYCLSIIGIPFGIQLFKIGMFVLHPFGYSVDDNGGAISGCLNIIWIIFGGLTLAVFHLIIGIFLSVTIIGIPFAVIHFRLAWFALVPFGRAITKDTSGYSSSHSFASGIPKVKRKKVEKKTTASGKGEEMRNGMRAGFGILILILVIGALGIAIYYFVYDNNSNRYPTESALAATTIEMTPDDEDSPSVMLPKSSTDAELIPEIIDRYTRACVNNDFSTLEELYAPFVECYISENNLIRDSVLAHHMRYDEFFRVYDKFSSVRWNTLEINRLEDDRWSVEYIEDYTLNREDPSLYSVFVRKMHLILNEYLEIVCVEEEILEKGYQEDSYSED